MQLEIASVQVVAFGHYTQYNPEVQRQIYERD